MPELQIADYVVGAVLLTTTVTGLFRGFSGTFAFVVAVIGAATAGTCSWTYSAAMLPALWMRGALTLVVALLAFGLVRMVVKKIVNGLLSQPSDALLGMLVGAAFSLALLTLWAWSGWHLEYSALARLAAGYLR